MLSNEEKYLFNLSAISHEIRNPVAIISSYLQLTQRKHPEVTGFDTWQPLMENMDFLKQLLQDISSYTNASKLHKTLSSLTVFLDHLVQSCQPALLPVTLSFDHPEDTSLSYFDKDRMRCVFLNLIRNSYEAIKDRPDGKIHLTLSISDDNYIISVTDNGEMIPAQHLSTLFQPFVTYKAEGTGLGLALVHEIISAHKGTISVCSTWEETCFQITLPICHKA